MSEERFKGIEDTVKDLAAKVTHLDTSFSEVSVSLKDYSNWTKQLERAISKLDDTVRTMNLEHQQIPYERVRDIEARIDPIHDTLRLYNEKFLSKREANTLTSISVFFISFILILLGIFGKYILEDTKSAILDSGELNREQIINNAKAMENHNQIRDEIIKKIHTHTKVNNNAQF